MMTKRDFEIIANVISELPNDDSLDRYTVMQRFAQALKLRNNNFNYVRFRARCLGHTAELGS